MRDEGADGIIGCWRGGRGGRVKSCALSAVWEANGCFKTQEWHYKMYPFTPRILTEDPFRAQQRPGQWDWKGGGGTQKLVRYRNN